MLNASRQRPVICCLHVLQTDLICKDKPSHIAWHKLDQSALRMYETELSRLFTLKPANLGTDIESCIDSRYNAIIDCVRTVSDSTLPKTSFRPYLKSYWRRVLKDLYAVIREQRRNWISSGRPRSCNNSLYNDYKEAKHLFRSQHRVCAENYLLKLMQKSTKLLKVIVESSGKSLLHKDNSHRLMLGVSFVLAIQFVEILKT